MAERFAVQSSRPFLALYLLCCAMYDAMLGLFSLSLHSFFNFNLINSVEGTEFLDSRQLRTVVGRGI